MRCARRGCVFGGMSVSRQLRGGAALRAVRSRRQFIATGETMSAGHDVCESLSLAVQDRGTTAHIAVSSLLPGPLSEGEGVGGGSRRFAESRDVGATGANCARALHSSAARAGSRSASPHTPIGRAGAPLSPLSRKCGGRFAGRRQAALLPPAEDCHDEAERACENESSDRGVGDGARGVASRAIGEHQDG